MRELLSAVNGVLYYPILIIVLLACGFYFTIRTKFIQFGLLGEAFKVITEKPEGKDDVSSFQALMVSTASRVGTGNIVGVANAICLGGPGAVFWMWIIALIGGASAFIESTLAQIYKKRGSDGVSYGGPSYYIENALGSRGIGVLFAVALIATYAVGFNMLASFNLQDSFRVYDFYVPGKTSWMIGAVLAVLAGYCILGGGKRIIKYTSLLVPVMGVIFVVMALIMIVINAKNIPAMFGMIFEDAFNFKAIFGGVAGSALVQGIKRGLYSNEAGMGSAPNAAASASVSHPVKQGLVQMISVFLDTLVICSATAFMSLASGIAPTEELAGAPFVQASLATVFGRYGNLFITVSLALFAFTTLLGNLYYVDSCLTYLNKKTPSKTFMLCYRIIATILIFVGAGMEMSLAWDIADFLMGVMCLINIPTIIILGGTALKALDDYKKQREEGKNPVFKAETIGIDTSKLDYWK
ncbi:MAG: alanine/glycine:cation symporter family protein [Peptoniphilus harei]|uniref:Amino acid carrier protein n=1 Tax=Peptoniphilus harei ACS-146-V-Sch2b TaxID=908338 RepID=E4KWV1_9FIRM|nr:MULTISPECIES: alanine/glycine:cation symporter family protein [Peptoniphilus]EFR33602.1 amino acid carrier protein [Peptoniphilus harei ACS-146-V-Sch2b]MDK7376991.1 alanine/glycine:cation symporter family protein [Peptoniphilus harei]MDK7678541.1 alanine/glycine:cation symporter family protein [Peptoniphilus harei]MDK7754663.1 alanine/glycine:cation symporter family protein [Peptoniphilus harei]MDK7760469.1 alanine/glycine:cation symporter family protein [Peptoniphilus harei]